jgi:hypothetical protein
MGNSWQYDRDIMGKSWEYHGNNIMGTSWECHVNIIGNPRGISWEDFMGDSWEYYKFRMSFNNRTYSLPLEEGL